MNSSFRSRLASLWRAEFLSPKDFLRRALGITFAFLIALLLGFREFTSMLNGTMGAVEYGRELSTVFGVSYILLYLAFVLLVPILILAAIILALWRKVLHHSQRTP
jgi:hypothetical protein